MDKIYFCENWTGNELEEFYVVETGYGIVLEFSLDDTITTWDSMLDFKSCWKKFDKYAQLTRVL